MHEVLGVSREVGDGDWHGGEGEDVFGLVAVDELEDVVYLGFWSRDGERFFCVESRKVKGVVEASLVLEHYICNYCWRKSSLI